MTAIDKEAVRKVLNAVKADKRTSLTAPEGKLVCDAYGIPVPKKAGPNRLPRPPGSRAAWVFPS